MTVGEVAVIGVFLAVLAPRIRPGWSPTPPGFCFSRKAEVMLYSRRPAAFGVRLVSRYHGRAVGVHATERKTPPPGPLITPSFGGDLTGRTSSMPYGSDSGRWDKRSQPGPTKEVP
jgi:hypothetical protein